jgi:hypothetical protein
MSTARDGRAVEDSLHAAGDQTFLTVHKQLLYRGQGAE